MKTCIKNGHSEKKYSEILQNNKQKLFLGNKNFFSETKTFSWEQKLFLGNKNFFSERHCANMLKSSQI